MYYHAESMYHSHGATVAQKQFCYSYNEHNEVKRQVILITSTAISEKRYKKGNKKWFKGVRACQPSAKKRVEPI